MQYLSPKLDIVFKKIFGNKDNADMLRSLVGAYLDIDTSGTFKLSNTEITPAELDNKFARLDLRISTEKEEIDIEVQVQNEFNYKERSLYYWSGLYSSTVKSGEDYRTARKTFTLNILDFNLFDCEDFNTNFIFYDPKNGIMLSDKARISFVELPKIQNITKEQIRNDERIAWAAFFNAKREEDFNMLNQTTINPNVQKAVTIIRELSADEKIQREAQIREDALLNEKLITSAAKAEGELENKIKTVQKMLLAGEPIDKIMLYTELSEKKILEIQNSKLKTKKSK